MLMEGDGQEMLGYPAYLDNTDEGSTYSELATIEVPLESFPALAHPHFVGTQALRWWAKLGHRQHSSEIAF